MRFTLLLIVSFFASGISLNAQTTFILGPSGTTETAGVSDGDTVRVVGDVIVGAGQAVRVNNVADGITVEVLSGVTVSSSASTGLQLQDAQANISFNNAGNISSSGGGGRGVFVRREFSGTFTNSGNVSSSAAEGIDFVRTFDGTFSNTGSISSSVSRGLDFSQAFMGTFNNSGNISSTANIGLRFVGAVTGTFTNSGTISSTANIAVRTQNTFNGTFQNSGTIFSTMNNAVSLGVPTGTAIGQDFMGTFVNTGMIRSDTAKGVVVGRVISGVRNGDFVGDFNNSGTVQAQSNAFHAQGEFRGNFINSGTLRTNAGNVAAVLISQTFTGTFNNSGSISNNGSPAVNMIQAFEGSFTNSGTISSINGRATTFNNDFTGTFLNTGTMSSESNRAVFVNRLFNGTFMNEGTLTSGGMAGTNDNTVFLRLNFNGTFNNSGTIYSGMNTGVYFDRAFVGTFTNTGIIEAPTGNGVHFGGRGNAGDTMTGTLTNDGGRITGGMNAILLGNGNGTVVLSRVSQIQGLMDGQAGDGDVLRFENMRGVSEATQDQLAALAAADSPGLTTITLFGETISWQNFEDIQADLASIQSYSSLITGPGLQNYAFALDNVLGLTDEFRDYLNALADVPVADLNDVAANNSGQTVLNAINDFHREHNTQTFSLFSSHFSSLRGDVPGATSNGFGFNPVSGSEPAGLFAREVQVGAYVMPEAEQEAPGFETFVTGYAGNASQDQRSAIGQAASDVSQVTYLFGIGDEFANGWYGGIFGNYARSEGTIDTFGSNMVADGASFGLNAQVVRDTWFANFAAGLGTFDLGTNRVDFQASRFRGETDATQAFFFAQTGWDFQLGREGNIHLTPYLGASFSSLEVDGYTEAGGGIGALRFDDESTTSTQTVLGVNYSSRHDGDRAWIRPVVDVAWWNAYDENSGNVQLATPGLLNPFEIFTTNTNQSRAVVQVGAEFGPSHDERWAFNAGYLGVYGEDGYSSHGGTFGARFVFDSPPVRSASHGLSAYRGYPDSSESVAAYLALEDSTPIADARPVAPAASAPTEPEFSDDDLPTASPAPSAAARPVPTAAARPVSAN